MRRTHLIILTLLIALGTVEGLAYWWMHPAPTGLGQPVLAYRPQVGRDPARSAHLSPSAPAEIEEPQNRNQHSQDRSQEDAPISSNNQQSKINNQPSEISSSPTDRRSPITDHFSSATHTPLPEIYENAAPMLRCTSGVVLRADRADEISLHLAFFEWDGTDTGSVLEAFRHMPEACMGSIGMKLISREKPIFYQVGRAAGKDSLDSSRAEPHSTSNIQHPTSPQPGTTLVFDHTTFREPGQTGGTLIPGPLVHAFRAVWVSGVAEADARQGLGGLEFDRLRTIRIKSALSRYRPGHARVIQGAVRGAPNRQAAWQAFEQTMLRDLAFESPR